METTNFKCECGWIGSIPTMDRSENDYLHFPIVSLCPECGKNVSKLKSPPSFKPKRIFNQHLERISIPVENHRIEPEKYYTGYLTHFNPVKGYGSIHVDGLGNVNCYEKILETLSETDLLIFYLEAQKGSKGKHIAKRLQIAYISKDNRIVLGYRFKEKQHEHLNEILPKIIGDIECGGREIIVDQLDFNHFVGESICVEVDKKDKIIYARKRTGTQKVLSKFVKFQLPSPTKSVTVVLSKSSDYYIIKSAYFGRKSEAFPWDDNKTDQSVSFWKNRALIYEENIIDKSSITSICPWGKDKKTGFGSFLF